MLHPPLLAASLLRWRSEGIWAVFIFLVPDQVHRAKKNKKWRVVSKEGRRRFLSFGMLPVYVNLCTVSDWILSILKEHQQVRLAHQKTITNSCSFTFGEKVYFVIFIEKFYFFFPLLSGLDSLRFWSCIIYWRCKSLLLNVVIIKLSNWCAPPPLICFCKYGMPKRRDFIHTVHGATKASQIGVWVGSHHLKKRFFLNGIPPPWLLM